LGFRFNRIRSQLVNVTFESWQLDCRGIATATKLDVCQIAGSGDFPDPVVSPSFDSSSRFWSGGAGPEFSACIVPVQTRFLPTFHNMTARPRSSPDTPPLAL